MGVGGQAAVAGSSGGFADLREDLLRLAKVTGLPERFGEVRHQLGALGRALVHRPAARESKLTAPGASPRA